jgi:hypothetical protein
VPVLVLVRTSNNHDEEAAGPEAPATAPVDTAAAVVAAVLSEIPTGSSDLVAAGAVEGGAASRVHVIGLSNGAGGDGREHIDVAEAGGWLFSALGLSPAPAQAAAAAAAAVPREQCRRPCRRLVLHRQDQVYIPLLKTCNSGSAVSRAIGQRESPFFSWLEPSQGYNYEKPDSGPESA